MMLTAESLDILGFIEVLVASVLAVIGGAALRELVHNWRRGHEHPR